MARVLNPLMSLDASGSVAGVQFSRNRSGSFGSRKSTSTRAQGDRVLEYRAHIARAHHLWHKIDDPRKATWDLTPDTHVKPREHFLKLYLKRAARGLVTGWTYPGLRGYNGLLDLVAGRQPGPLTMVSCGWIPQLPTPAYIDFTARATYLHSFDGHPRKFKWHLISTLTPEFATFPLTPYARFLTLHVAIRDFYTLHIYHRWVLHFDDDDLISITPDWPQN